MFKQRIKVFHGTFRYLCEKLGSHLRKQHTSMRDPISVEDRVVRSLMKLGSGNGVQLMSDFFGVEAKGTISMIVREFCHMVRLHLRKLFVQFPTKPQFRVLSKEFEGLHGIPHIISAIDGSHTKLCLLIVITKQKKGLELENRKKEKISTSKESVEVRKI